MLSNMPSHGTILLVDDIEDNIRTVLGILDQHDIIPCTSGAEALKIMREESIDLVLLDIMMPEMNGFEVCEKIRQNPEWEEIPIIFLTAKQDEDSIEQAYDMGAHDYVTKPFLPRELKARVEFQLRFHFTMKRLEYLASHDPMTGIFNRRRFFDDAKRCFLSIPREQFFVIVMDIDHFKSINDKYGHAVGDVALKSLTKTVSSVLIDDAIFARLGGEEFVIAFQADNVEAANAMAENIRNTVAETPITCDQLTFYCSISLGMSQNSTSFNTIDELLNSADEALYEAKDNGRNRTIFRNYNPKA